MAAVFTTRAAATRARRADILEAALLCFVEKGFARATIEEIRLAAGASIGSLYHHFPSKEDLGAALYVEGLADYQAGMVAVLDGHLDAEDGVKAAVLYHLRWVVEHADLARFLFSVREPDVVGSRAEELRELNHGFFRAVRAWLAHHAEAGTIRRLPPDLYYALWIGPAQELARNLVSGRVRTGWSGRVRTGWKAAATVLCDAAWDALQEGRR